MDFSYFTSGPQPYHFFGLPDTPANGHAQLDEYQQNGGQVSHVPLQHTYKLTSLQDQYDAAFAAFQQNFHYDPSSFVVQPQQQLASTSQPQSPIRPAPIRHDSTISMPDIDPNDIEQGPNDITPDEGLPGTTNRSSSEEKENLTPQQNRRKAQNRAA